MESLHKDGTSCTCGEAGQTTRAGLLSDLVNVLSDSRDRDTFVVEGISVKAGMVLFVDSVEEDIFWMGSFGEDAVEVNWVKGESP